MVCIPGSLDRDFPELGVEPGRIRATSLAVFLGALPVLATVALWLTWRRTAKERRREHRRIAETPHGLAELKLLDMTGQMLYTDAERTQAALAHVARPEAAKRAFVERQQLLSHRVLRLHAACRSSTRWRSRCTTGAAAARRHADLLRGGTTDR